MQRWMGETMREQPWNGVGSFAISSSKKKWVLEREPTRNNVLAWYWMQATVLVAIWYFTDHVMIHINTRVWAYQSWQDTSDFNASRENFAIPRATRNSVRLLNAHDRIRLVCSTQSRTHSWHTKLFWSRSSLKAITLMIKIPRSTLQIIRRSA